MKVTIDAIKMFAFLADPNRKTFKQFCDDQRVARPSYVIMPYISSVGANGAAMSSYYERNMINDIHRNYRKTALICAPGQAAIELAIMSAMCKEMIEHNNPYPMTGDPSFFSVCCLAVAKELAQLNPNLFNAYPNIVNAMNHIDDALTECFITEKTINYIIDLWGRNPIAIYDMDYKVLKENHA